MRSDRLYLEDIVQACDAVLAFVHGRDEAAFSNDDLVRSAVLFKLIVIGEATGKVSASLRASHPNIPWLDIVSFRNFAVHTYFGVDWSIVWTTAAEDVPVLRREIATVLAGLPLGAPP
jgi:uncharacterized protein with HEPN domain